MEDGSPFCESQIRQIIKEVAVALFTLHKSQKAHLNLKPGLKNIRIIF